MSRAASAAPPATTPRPGWTVSRTGLTSWLGSAGYLGIVAVLAFVPVLFIPNVIQQMTSQHGVIRLRTIEEAKEMKGAAWQVRPDLCGASADVSARSGVGKPASER